jgi:hypothetical protein
MRCSRLLAAALVVASFVPSAVAHAGAPLSENTLVKSTSNNTVYWYANDGKRYVFPNLKTYYTWFSSDDFNRVRVLTDADLASFPLGGNVTYRGGAKLVKITTDPKVYAVSRYGILHWVPSEYIATQLYGSNWATMVEDIPDAFFINYTIGAPLSQVSDFSVSAEYNGVRTPSDNLRLNPYLPVYPSQPQPPVSTVFGSVTLNAATQSPRFGDTDNLYAQVSSLNVSMNDIAIDIYDEFGTLLRSCDRQTSCLHPLQITNTFTRRSYFARIRHLPSGQQIDSSRIVIDPGYNTYQPPVQSPVSSETLQMSFNRNSYATPGELFVLYANVGASGSSGALYNISIYDQNNLLLGSCYSARNCNAQTSLRSDQPSMTYYAVATRVDGGATLQSSRTTMYTNGTSFANGTLNISLDRTIINNNEYATIATELRNYNGPTASLRTELYDDRTGSLAGVCTGTIYCNFNIQSTQLNAQSGSRFYAIVTNGNGTRIQSGYTSTLSLSSSASGYGPLAQQVLVTISPSLPRIGEPYTVSTQVSGLRVPVDQITVELYDSILGIRQRCVGTTSCGYTANEWQTISKDIYALLRSASGEVLRSESWRLNVSN